MKIIKLYRQYRDKWWAPLILPVLLLPLARWANTDALLDGNEVYLYYLPLALVLSLMLFFGWAALPGIVLGLLLTITRGMTLEDSIGVISSFSYSDGSFLGRVSRFCPAQAANLAWQCETDASEIGLADAATIADLSCSFPTR
jgi:hypothetical protein